METTVSTPLSPDQVHGSPSDCQRLNEELLPSVSATVKLSAQKPLLDIKHTELSENETSSSSASRDIHPNTAFDDNVRHEPSVLSLESNGTDSQTTTAPLHLAKQDLKASHVSKSYFTALYCADLVPRASKGQLRHIFSRFAGYESTHLPMRTTVLSKGYAFVHFKDNASAEAAFIATRGQKLHKAVLKLSLSRPLSADQIRRYERANEPRATAFSRMNPKAVTNDKELKARLMEEDRNRALSDPGYMALSAKIETDLDLGSFCEYLNNTLRYFEVTYPGDTKARRHFRVWEDHFAAIKDLAKVFSNCRSKFVNLEDFEPIDDDDEEKKETFDKVVTAMHRLSERNLDKQRYMKIFDRDIKFGPCANYETSMEWKARKCRQGIVHSFRGGVQRGMRWRFIHQVFLEDVPLILKDVESFEKLFRRGYGELCPAEEMLREGEMEEADMDLETSEDDRVWSNQQCVKGYFPTEVLNHCTRL